MSTTDEQWNARPMRLAVLLAAALTAACTGAGAVEEQPEISDDIDDYKRSPCACVEVEQLYPEGWNDWMLGG